MSTLLLHMPGNKSASLCLMKVSHTWQQRGIKTLKMYFKQVEVCKSIV